MRFKLHKTLLISALITTTACSPTQTTPSNTTIFVSIEPTAWVVESICDSTVRVEVLVPGATSPETFEPTARQVAELSESDLYLTIGHFGFEGELAARMAEGGCPTSDLSRGIELIEGACNHHDHSHDHSHGIDPHIWLSPKSMAVIVNNTAVELERLGVLNHSKRDSLLNLIASIDSTITSTAKRSNIEGFAIVHPSLGYFANDYNLKQIALEIDGKEPTIRSIKESLSEMQRRGVTTILHSSHDSDDAAKVLSAETKLPLTPFEPLAYNWPETMNGVAIAIFNK